MTGNAAPRLAWQFLTPAQSGIGGVSPVTLAAILALLVTLALIGVVYTRGAFDGILGSSETSENVGTRKDSTESMAGGQPFEASEDAEAITPSNQKPYAETRVEVQGTRQGGPLGTLIKVEVKDGELGVGDTVTFGDAGIEGRIGKLERDGQSVETVSEGDVVSFSLVGVGEAPVEEGTIGQKASN